MATLAEQLRGPDRLDTLAAGDTGTNVRHVFSCSYRTLSPVAARLFRLLGVFPGPAVGLGAAAGLTGLPRSEALALLTELERANLLTEQTAHRYVLHDLLRAYAMELAYGQESEAELRAARGRVLDYCLHSAQAVARALQGAWCYLPLPTPVPGVVPEEPRDIEAASAWFDTELTVLVAAVRDAADGFEGHCWRLAWSVSSLLSTRGRWAEYTATQELALAATERVGDRTGQAYARQSLGRAARRCQESVSLRQELGEMHPLAGSWDSLGYVHSRLGHHRQAIECYRSSLALYRLTGERYDQAFTMSRMADAQAAAGDTSGAVESCRQALAILDAFDDAAAEEVRHKLRVLTAGR